MRGTACGELGAGGAPQRWGASVCIIAKDGGHPFDFFGLSQSVVFRLVIASLQDEFRAENVLAIRIAGVGVKHGKTKQNTLAVEENTNSIPINDCPATSTNFKDP